MNTAAHPEGGIDGAAATIEPPTTTATAAATRPPRRWTMPALEATVAFLTAAVFVASSFFIRVNPMDRLGQVSGIAGLALRFAVAGIVLVVALVLAARRTDERFDNTSRLVCAAIAGLATGMIGGGILVALRGTPWGLNGRGGDVGHLAGWAAALHRGDPDAIPPSYPPLPLHLLHLYSDLMHMAPGLALKHFEIAGCATFGPIVYLTWRLLLRPPWALAIGVVSALPLVEPYKPYPTLVLAVFLPIAILFLQALRRCASWPHLRIARASIVYAAVFGGLCLMYSGWFQWALPGLAVAAMIVFPWRDRRKGFYLLGFTGAMFLLITRQYVLGVASEAGIKDTFVYFDVRAEPVYIAMWRNDTPGITGPWPPIGELGGVGLFTLILAVGFGAAVMLGRRRTLLIGLVSMMAGAWIMRFRYARLLWETKLVQLYPRTTPLILYCLLVLTGFAVYWWTQRAAKDSPVRSRHGLIGAVCGLLLFFGSAGSSISDRYMPVNTNPPSAGWLAWNAQQTKRGPRPIKSRALPWIRRSVAPSAPSP
jgi:galactan 5-O-arabinofuranosyltransferase